MWPSILLAFLVLLIIFMKEGRVLHSIKWGARLICADPKCVWAVAHWWFRLAFCWKAAPHRTVQNLRFYRILPGHYYQDRVKAWMDRTLAREQELLHEVADNNAAYGIVRMPVPFLKDGLCNGPHLLPAHTLVAVYLSDLIEEEDNAVRSSRYLFKYGKSPSYVGGRVLYLDGRPRLGEAHSNLNAAFIKHSCVGNNCVFEWVDDRWLAVRTARIIQPFEQLTAEYQMGFYDMEATQQFKARGYTVAPCLCSAPVACPLGRSLASY